MQSEVNFSYSQNLLQTASKYILQNAGDQLPDLHSVVVLLPHQNVSSAFRQQLLKTVSSQYPAIIPPWIGTLKDWITQHIPVSSQYSIIDEQNRRLLFINSLKDYPDLFREENKWQVTIALLQLFDELTLQQTNIPDSAEWLRFIQNSYGLEQHPHCNREADIVHSLWHAWHQQLDANSLKDITGDYVSRLFTAQQHIEQNTLTGFTSFFCIGGVNLPTAEQNFIEFLVNRQQCSRIKFTADIAAEQNSFQYFIEQCFACANPSLPPQSLYQRVESLKQYEIETVPLSYFPAPDNETQVRAIDLQIRLWLLDKQHNIGIICEDRKLSRRLRALLERADIPVQDLSGWPLSTTQAASIIERWLQCIEDDFDSRPLLDCLKSPYLQSHFASLLLTNHNTQQSGTKNATVTPTDRKKLEDEFKYIIYRFEHDIILHENINSHIDRYRKHLALRRKKLTHWPENTYQNLLNIINRIELIAAPLVLIYKSKHTFPASSYLSALTQCLNLLGITQAYREDAAGLRILQTLDELQAGLYYADPEFSWQDFRFWLANALEEKLFSPQTQNSSVKLMTLDQAELLEFDAVIIAATEAQYFPGKSNNNPFFNQSVRHALGLGNWEQDYTARFKKFRQLLFSAPKILITSPAEENGEAIPVSPWLELLIQFHQQVFGFKPLNTELADLLETDSSVFRCDTEKLPKKYIQPQPALNTALIPQRISASSHQRLIDCPYLFFCSDGLKLKPAEEITTELSKSDYGERVHAILQNFHRTEDKILNKFKAFTEEINEHNREQAENHLRKISTQIFRHDLEDNVLHRSWLQRWLRHIPSYISWQIERQKDWCIDRTEQQITVAFDKSYQLYGRLDRIDKQAHIMGNHYAIIDYKTGKSATQKTIESGEDVQLTTYALLEEASTEIMYLSLDYSDYRVKSGAILYQDRLADYRSQTRQRLTEMLTAINQQHPLPAWGDKRVCQYCHFSGICRRQQWHKSD